MSGTRGELDGDFRHADELRSLLRPSMTRLACPFWREGCKRTFSKKSGQTQHVNWSHISLPRASPPTRNAAAKPDSTDDSTPSQSPTHPVVDDGAFDVRHEHTPRPESAPEPRQTGARVDHHPYLDGRPCDKAGNFIEPGTRPIVDHPPEDDFSPYESLGAFRMVARTRLSMTVFGTSALPSVTVA
uniref:C2H2-type domain-containing protein n=1 Tax=Mycena chlorophos TaxID=658473 RepID=A0ABQ0LUZ7_MYCCL|nr:predicted protein [Mycena chlorophos]